MKFRIRYGEAKERIKALYVNQYNFARNLRCSDSDVSLVVRGRKTLDRLNARKWCVLLGAELLELFDETCPGDADDRLAPGGE